MPTPVTLPTLAWGSPHAAKHALLIHGLGSNGALMWRYGVALADAGWHATAVDLRGQDVLAFQRLWNRNHPEDKIGEDGKVELQNEIRGERRNHPVIP